jgi:Tfp pilus assembly protein PilF
VIYCINPNCESRINLDEVTKCAACSTSLRINNRFILIKKIEIDEQVECFEIIDNQSGYSGPAGSHKILKILKNLDPERREAFINESEILQSLNHEGIPKVDALYDSFELNIKASNRKIYCLIMSKFEGVTLERYIEDFGAISQEQAINFLHQIANILSYIHTKEFDDFIGIIHRDIKPSNIIVQPNYKLALIDFGFALQMTERYFNQMRKGELSAVTSMFYTAPEQQSRKPVLQSDYYSLGMTIIFAVTGKPIYEIEVQPTTWKLKWKKYTKIAKPLIDVLEKLTESNPTKRPADAEALDKLLHQTLLSNLRTYNLYRSKFFLFLAFTVAVFVILGLVQLARNRISNYLLDLGNKALKENQFTDARHKLEDAVRVLPNANAYNNLGIACNELGDLNCEKHSYEKAIALSPQNWAGYYQLGMYYEDKLNPDFREAERLYRKAVELNPRALLANNNLVRVLILNANYRQAEAFLNQSINLTMDKKSEAVLKKNFGWLYVQTRQYDKAEKQLKKSITLDPSLISPHCLLAKVYESQGVSASNEIQLCLSLNGEDAVYPEVSRWRKQRIDVLLNQKSSQTVDSSSS